MFRKVLLKTLGRPRFSETNECLDAILIGMKPQEDEKILSICGSGQQPKIISSSGSNVLAVDNYSPQIRFARGSIFKGRGYETDKLKFREGDIFNKEFKKGETFDSIYLSNALSYSLGFNIYKDIIDENDNISQFNYYNDNLNLTLDRLNQGGKIYLADGFEILKTLKKYSEYTEIYRFMNITDNGFEFNEIENKFPRATSLDRINLEFLSTLNSVRFEKINSEGYFKPTIIVKK